MGQVFSDSTELGPNRCPELPRRLPGLPHSLRSSRNLRGGTIACVDDESWLHSGPEGAPCSIAGTMWHWVHPGSRPRGRVAQSILPQIIIRICAGLTQWASVEEEPKTSMLVALQEGGRKHTPSIVVSVAAEAEETEDGGGVES